MPAIGKRIKNARLKKGWTQKELAEKVGSTYVVIGYYERNQRGRKRPDPSLLIKLCEALDISMDYLFIGKDHCQINIPGLGFGILVTLKSPDDS